MLANRCTLVSPVLPAMGGTISSIKTSLFALPEASRRFLLVADQKTTIGNKKTRNPFLAVGYVTGRTSSSRLDCLNSQDDDLLGSAGNRDIPPLSIRSEGVMKKK